MKNILLTGIQGAQAAARMDNGARFCLVLPQGARMLDVTPNEVAFFHVNDMHTELSGLTLAELQRKTLALDMGTVSIWLERG